MPIFIHIASNPSSSKIDELIPEPGYLNNHDLRLLHQDQNAYKGAKTV